ncbi:MAG TPA: DUF4097 family beta strand repeat-containing protein [Actinomycetales bacterium]|nr:DUF4097 family beta strand repeat-containing protein [Actinomycetales bacterium]
MPTFATPHPIAAVIEVAGAMITVHAGERAETSVDLRPHNPDRHADLELAKQTTVDFADGRLVVRSPRTARARFRSLIGGGDRVDLDVALPAGSTLEVRGWADVTAEGTLDMVDVETSMGDIDLDRVTGRVRAKTSMGDIRIGSAMGPAELRSSAGSLQVGWAGADVTARTSAGDVRIHDGEGELRLSTSTGDVRVERAASAVSAKASTGDIRLNSVRSGSVTAECSYGQLEIGVANGSAAWLDVEARHGVVRSELEGTDGPGEANHTVEIHATTGYGDILLRRA